MSGPGFTMRSETPADRRNWLKPWVSPRYRRRRGAIWAIIIHPPRGVQHDPERTRAKALEKREHQSKVRR